MKNQWQVSWTTLALVIDCHTRELLGWHLSRSGKATTAASALEHALISRFGTLGKLTRPIMRPSTGFHANQARGYAREEQHHLRPPDLTADHNRASNVTCVNLEHVLGQIEADRGNLRHGSLPSWVCVTAPNVAHCDAGSGSHPLHQWRLDGSLFTSRRYTALVRSYGLKQEFITPHCPQQNGMVERVIRTLKEQCIHRQRFDSIQHATRAIGDWISFYNNRRPHQALDMKTPAEAFALAA